MTRHVAAPSRLPAFPALSLVILVGCSGTSTTTVDPAPALDGPARVTAIADDYWKGFGEFSPLFATLFGFPDAANDRLDDNSLVALRRWQAREDRWAADLARIDTVGLATRPEAITYGILYERLEASRQSRVCRYELWRVNQQSGLQILLPFLGRIQPLGTVEARAATIARWRLIPHFIDVEITNLKEGVQEGYTAPRGNVTAVIEQLDGLLQLSPAESPMAEPARRDSTPEFRRLLVELVAKEITPAMRRYREFLAADYLPAAREAIGVSALPNGTECYRARVRAYTTLDLDPRGIHQLGLDEMARIEAEMRTVALRSFGTSDVHALLHRLRTDPEYLFRTREEIIAVSESAFNRAKAAMPKWFGRLPKADMIIDPCQPFEEKAGCPGSYVPGAADGSSPGRFRINAGDPTTQPRAPAEATAFHEGIPGHHLQIAIARERSGAHLVARYFFNSGFAEGWALYAEQLAHEMGLYSSDIAEMGRLDQDALRAARLVVDPGLHVLGWTRQQAIDYMLAHTADSRTTVESEVDRYIIDPGQATAYMVGRLEIERLRREAEGHFKSGFDIRAFHDHVLEDGNVTLPMLRPKIERWLATGDF